jgi:hypothetical protein
MSGPTSFFKKLKAALAPKTEVTLHDLLARGYFPAELPPPFDTSTFADVATKPGASLPLEFTKKKHTWCDYTPYSLARPGNLRRRLAVIHPLAFYRLGSEVCKHQKTLFKMASPSVVCLSHPKVSTIGPRAITTYSPLSDLPAARARSRVGKRFVLKTDIVRFYPSIYTHTLDWAITGKKKAKSAFGPNVNRLGKRIDALVQASQNGQTRGIPIGPDTSLLLAHLLLAPVDQILKRNKISHGFRFMDDYELTFETRTDAEKALATLEEGLAEYELELNTLKTSIVELPLEIESSAIISLRRHTMTGARGIEKSSLIEFFNTAFALANAHPNKAILRFAVGRIRNHKGSNKHPKLTQDLILQCATIEPGVWPQAIPCLQKLHRNNLSLTKEPIKAVVDVTIRQQAPRQHSSEVAWALWAALVFAQPLTLKAIKAVIRMNDDVCSLLLLHLKQEGLANLDAWCMKHLTAMADVAELRGAHWLFSYESVAKGWIVPSGGSYLPSDPVFGFLHGQAVTFYDESVLGAARSVKTPEADGHPRTASFGYSEESTDDELLDLLDELPDFEGPDLHD